MSSSVWIYMLQSKILHGIYYHYYKKGQREFQIILVVVCSMRARFKL